MWKAIKEGLTIKLKLANPCTFLLRQLKLILSIAFLRKATSPLLLHLCRSNKLIVIPFYFDSVNI